MWKGSMTIFKVFDDFFLTFDRFNFRINHSLIFVSVKLCLLQACENTEEFMKESNLSDR